MTKEGPPDFNEMKAPFHRDAAAGVGVVFAAVIAVLAVGFANPGLESTVLTYILGAFAFALAVALGLSFWKMLEYDKKRVNAAAGRK